MFGLWKKKPRIAGYIGHYGLQDWWLSALSPDEREWAEKTFSPMGSSTTLTRRNILQSSMSRVKFLSSAAPWFSKPGHHEVALAFADKLAEEITPAIHLEERHFAYSTLCKVYYRWRDVTPGSLEKAIAACEASVDMAHLLGGVISGGTSQPIPVSHHCYGQLIVIEKKGRVANVVEIAEQRAPGM